MAIYTGAAFEGTEEGLRRNVSPENRECEGKKKIKVSPYITELQAGKSLH